VVQVFASSIYRAKRIFFFESCDYSQLELRILAGLSRDRNMTQAFMDGADIHRMTAARVFGVVEEDVKPPERRIAKALNFGLVYGMGSSSFAASSGVTRSAAQDFIKAYFKNFSGVAQWMESTRQEAHRRGYVETLTGRRRYFPDINTGNPRVVAENERQAVNHPVQGLEADFIKLAMIKTEAMLRERNVWGKSVRMLLTIHDELLFEVENDMIEEITPFIRKTMEEVWPSFAVPLVVEAARGATWGDMEKMEIVPRGFASARQFLLLRMNSHGPLGKNIFWIVSLPVFLAVLVASFLPDFLS